LRRSQTSARSAADDSHAAQRAGVAMDLAVARLRFAESLEPFYSMPPIDLINPKIPKAPALPHDLSRMPNAQLPIWSDPPSWALLDPISEEPTAAPSAPASEPWSSGPVSSGRSTGTLPLVDVTARNVGAQGSTKVRKSDLIAVAVLLAVLAALSQWVGF
jgi:hypothetical protein